LDLVRANEKEAEALDDPDRPAETRTT